MILCDTNIISELSRPSPNAGVMGWARSVGRVAVSVVTVDEIAFGLAAKPSSRIAAWMDGFFEQRCDVLPISREIAEISGRLRGTLRARGVAMTQADAFIAATAQLHAAVLVTRNVIDFEQAQVAILNPYA